MGVNVPLLYQYQFYQYRLSFQVLYVVTFYYAIRVIKMQSKCQ